MIQEPQNTGDERLGLPSGSSALQDSLCAGRFQLQRQWDLACPDPEIEEEGEDNPEDIDRDREAGKRIHLLYAGKDCPGASQAEIDRAEKALRIDQTMKSAWLDQWSLEPLGQIHELREHRWWLYNENKEPIYSGQTDVVWIRGYQGQPADILVGDLKGLWGHHDEAPLNMQIRRYIALISENVVSMGYSHLRSAHAYLNQPAKIKHPILTPFDEDAIQMAVLEMKSDLAAMRDPDAKRTPGSVQCARCRAKLICPEYQDAEGKIMHVVSPIIPSLPLAGQTTNGEVVTPGKKGMEESLKLLSGDQLARLMPWLPALEDAVMLATAEAKRRLRIDEDSVPGWRLWPNAPRSKVEDLSKVYTRIASEYGTTGEQFTKLCSITKKNVIQIVREKSGLKGEALDNKVKEILDGATQVVKVSASLERVK